MTVKLKLNNVVINGGFDFWQRNTSFAAIANNIYHADRFHYIKTGVMVQTIARSTDVPTSSNSTYSLLSTVTTIDASIAAGDYTGILQHIEGNVLRSFKSKKMVMTFWVKAFKTGTYCVSLRNGTATRSLVLEYTVNASNTWEKKTVRFTHDASGTWSYDTAIGLTAVFVIASGSTFNTTANTWQNGQFFATANQVNGVDSVSNTFQLADICMVEDNDGQTRVPEFMYAGRDVFEELQLCQRYYWVQSAGGNGFIGPAHSTVGVYLTGNFSPSMRTGPIMSGQTGTFAINNVANFISSSQVPTGVSSDPNGFIVQIAGFTGLTMGAVYQQTPAGTPTGRITADAEL